MDQFLAILVSRDGPRRQLLEQLGRFTRAIVIVEGVSDIARARNEAARQAMWALARQPEPINAVMWVDDDMELPTETLKQHLVELSEAREKGAGALIGRYVQRSNPSQLAARYNPVPEPDAKELTPWGKPALGGMGALLQTRESFREQCKNAPPLASGAPMICMPMLVPWSDEPLPEGEDPPLQWWGEDFFYCAAVPGGAYLASDQVRYGHWMRVPVFPSDELEQGRRRA